MTLQDLINVDQDSVKDLRADCALIIVTSSMVPGMTDYRWVGGRSDTTEYTHSSFSAAAARRYGQKSVRAYVTICHFRVLGISHRPRFYTPFFVLRAAFGFLCNAGVGCLPAKYESSSSEECPGVCCMTLFSEIANYRYVGFRIQYILTVIKYKELCLKSHTCWVYQDLEGIACGLLGSRQASW